MSNLLGFLAVVCALAATGALFGPWVALYVLSGALGLAAYVAWTHERSAS